MRFYCIQQSDQIVSFRCVLLLWLCLWLLGNLMLLVSFSVRSFRSCCLLYIYLLVWTLRCTHKATFLLLLSFRCVSRFFFFFFFSKFKHRFCAAHFLPTTGYCYMRWHDTTRKNSRYRRNKADHTKAMEKTINLIWGA